MGLVAYDKYSHDDWNTEPGGPLDTKISGCDAWES